MYKKAEGSRDYGLLTDLAFFYDVMKGLFLCGCVWYYLASSLLSPFSFSLPLCKLSINFICSCWLSSLLGLGSEDVNGFE